MSKPEDFDFDTLMTCPYVIRDVGLNSPLFIVEPKMDNIPISRDVNEHEDAQFFKCYSKEHAQHVLKREWFKRIHAAITGGQKP